MSDLVSDLDELFYVLGQLLTRPVSFIRETRERRKIERDKELERKTARLRDDLAYGRKLCTCCPVHGPRGGGC